MNLQLSFGPDCWVTLWNNNDCLLFQAHWLPGSVYIILPMSICIQGLKLVEHLHQAGRRLSLLHAFFILTFLNYESMMKHFTGDLENTEQIYI